MKFLRRDSDKYSKLGKGRKKKQVWRRPTGRDNKMREKRKGRPAVVSLGYIKDKNTRGKLNDKEVVTVITLKDLEKVGKNKIALIGNVGKKKKLELAEKIEEKKIETYNLNVKKFLKENSKKKPDEEKESKVKGEKK